MKLLEVVLFLSFLGGIMGLSCYDCSFTESCSDPFTPSDSLKKTCSSLDGACYKLKAEGSGVSIIQRSCAPAASCVNMNDCFSASYQGATATACCCTGNYCNGASSLGVTSVMVTAAVGLVAMAIVV